jgi:hypothetical protein
MEEAIKGDVAFIRAWKVDEAGNAIFRYTSNNFSATMARGADLTIVEVRSSVRRLVEHPEHGRDVLKGAHFPSGRGDCPGGDSGAKPSSPTRDICRPDSQGDNGPGDRVPDDA